MKIMPLKYKIDVVASLKEKGYYPQRIRKEKILSESTMTKLRQNQPVSWENIETICRLLECQPGDILEYQED
jgi:putative transcriptional regulator